MQSYHNNIPNYIYNPKLSQDTNSRYNNNPSYNSNSNHKNIPDYNNKETIRKFTVQFQNSIYAFENYCDQSGAQLYY